MACLPTLVTSRSLHSSWIERRKENLWKFLSNYSWGSPWKCFKRRFLCHDNIVLFQVEESSYYIHMFYFFSLVNCNNSWWLNARLFSRLERKYITDQCNGSFARASKKWPICTGNYVVLWHYNSILVFWSHRACFVLIVLSILGINDLWFVFILASSSNCLHCCAL